MEMLTIGKLAKRADVNIETIKEKENLNFVIEELDITQHPELLLKHQIMVSPGIIIDGKLEFTGMPSKKKLREKLGKR